jgi:hypothetical protein
MQSAIAFKFKINIVVKKKSADFILILGTRIRYYMLALSSLVNLLPTGAR